MQQLIGQFALSLSLVGYFVWLLPQCLHNIKSQGQHSLHFAMHLLLLIGMLCDLTYGFGIGMPWQYRLVTLTGLVYLSFMHFSYAFYQQPFFAAKYYWPITLSLLAFSLVALSLISQSHNRALFDSFGLVSMFCWLIASLPQLYSNYQQQDSRSVNRGFAWLLMLTALLDVIACYCLNWDWPSKLSAPIGLSLKLLLLSQCYRYPSRLSHVVYAH